MKKKSATSSGKSARRGLWIAQFVPWIKQEQPLLHRGVKRPRLADLCFASGGASSISSYSSLKDEEEEDEELEVRPMMAPSSADSSSADSSRNAASSSFCSSGDSGAPVARSSSIALRDAEEWHEHGASTLHGMHAVASKRVMVVVDDSREAKTALLWTLSHVVHKLDVLTLLHVLAASQHRLLDDPRDSLSVVSDKARLRSHDKSCDLIASLKSLCALRQPEVAVEVVVVVAGERGPAIVRQAKKLDASILVLGQKKLNFFQRCLRWKDDQWVDYCIQHADCLTLSVRRKSKQCGGYLINSKWQKNFWLLA